MTTPDSPNAIARSYLAELDAALATAPAGIRTEMVADIADELSGLSDAETRARIAELGDPLVIAADATAGSREAVTVAVAPPPTKTYPTVAAVILTAGWYVAPVLGWIGGLVMIGVGAHWSSAVKRRAILASIIAGVVAILALLVFRGTEVWPIGLVAFLVVPLIANIFVDSYIRERWGLTPPGA
ncbi:hypothetical protein [Herbiconiux sp.]|uniref:HAAS signaling domain-containing protein n=1 Tax=Herbiconiux sp. TaxID=1871186 RepID=UPI0025B96613|nr:hypothetical protein [Herbiconiux sp.]